MQVLLVAREPALARAWRHAFEDIEVVEVIEGDYFAREAEAMVSPANSFGIMDGGIDAAIRDTLGFTVQQRLQRMIVERHHGELRVGCAEIVETGDARWPLLVCAPTMRIPESVATTLNAYLAFRSALLACARHPRPIASLTCCGLATGIGGMDPMRCAVQMRMAYRHATGPARIPSFNQIHAVHEALRKA
jgi:O-acetyl-ADP-ribose deacetylase (regulator of RNase III)